MIQIPIDYHCRDSTKCTTWIKVQLKGNVSSPCTPSLQPKMVAIQEKAKEQSDNQSIETETILFWNCNWVIWSIEVFHFSKLEMKRKKICASKVQIICENFIKITYPKKVQIILFNEHKNVLPKNTEHTKMHQVTKRKKVKKILKTKAGKTQVCHHPIVHRSKKVL